MSQVFSYRNKTKYKLNLEALQKQKLDIVSYYNLVFVFSLENGNKKLLGVCLHIDLGNKPTAYLAALQSGAWTDELLERA